MSLYLNDNKEKTSAGIAQQCSILASTIESKHDLLIGELLKYESFEAAEDEIRKSVDCLKNISKESEWLSYGKVDLLCTIIPINLPLYSLIIFAITPGFIANEVIIRPPVLIKDVFQKISELLNLEKLLPHIKFIVMERTLFGEAYISVADVVIFTGRYENAKIVQKICPNALFIYDGAGINPLIITDSANLAMAVEKTIKTRVFNSGQDCAGPDIIFVHKNILSKFKDKLLIELDKIEIGDYRSRAVRIGRILKINSLSAIKDFFNARTQSLVYGGKIDFQNGIVYPTVIIENIRELNDIVTMEFFAPVFYLLSYHDDNDLKKYFSQKSYRDFAMYTSIFGKVLPPIEIPNSTILHNQIINDTEQGNDPYGGYGPKTNYVSYDGIYYNRPLLISREICSYLKYRISRNKYI